MREKVTRQSPQATTFEEKGEPKWVRTEAPLLTSLTPYHLAKPAYCLLLFVTFGFYSSQFGVHTWHCRSHSSISRQSLISRCTSASEALIWAQQSRTLHPFSQLWLMEMVSSWQQEDNNNNNNVHLSRAHQRPERSHNTY